MDGLARAPGRPLRGAVQLHDCNHQLEGKLLIAHGDLDDNVPLPASIKLVDALITADKDFDFLVMPGRNHGFGNEPYFVRRRWDYFVQHLMHKLPPPRSEV